MNEHHDAADDNTEAQGIECPNCKGKNRVGVIFCEHCGTNLKSGQRPGVVTRHFNEGDPTIQSAEDIIKMRNAITGDAIFEPQMALKLEMEQLNQQLWLEPHPGDELVIGRRDPNSNHALNVDLAPYGAYPLGVSRRHAIIRYVDDTLEIEDLGSANGTFINGVRLTPGEPHAIHDGDELRIARMKIRVYFAN